MSDHYVCKHCGTYMCTGECSEAKTYYYELDLKEKKIKVKQKILIRDALLALADEIAAGNSPQSKGGQYAGTGPHREFTTYRGARDAETFLRSRADRINSELKEEAND